MIIGIDVGGSTTKIVGVKDGEIRNPMFVTAKDPVTSLFGAFGKYIYDHSIQLSEVEQVMLTGVGSSYIQQPLGLDRLMVVSMGTGTSFVKVEREKIRHVGGIGIGGGTLMGLSRLLLHTQDILWVSELAGKGNLQNVDLQIQDICQTSLPGLPLDATASLLGKLDNNVSPEDLALGLMHMVLQSIGQAAVLSALEMGIRDFVLIGNLTQLPQCRPVFDTIAQMYDVRFIIPANAEYQTAIGAALAYIKKIETSPVR